MKPMMKKTIQRAQKPGEKPVIVGYRLASVLHVDKLLRDDTGRIIGVQLIDREGRKAVWQES